MKEEIKGKEDKLERNEQVLATVQGENKKLAEPLKKAKEQVVEKIGVLLIDHGSKKTESNASLQILAEKYQESSMCPPHVIVGAAHMEIAPPSIEEGMRSLIDNGASK